MELSHWVVGLGCGLVLRSVRVLVGSGAEAAEMRVMGVGVGARVGVRDADAEAGMPVTRSRLFSPLEKEETLKALRSVICAGADQIILEVLDTDGSGDADGGVDGEADTVTIDVTISVMTTVLVLVVAARVGGDVAEAFEENGIETTELVVTRVISDGRG